jgi:hypothetical protein
VQDLAGHIDRLARVSTQVTIYRLPTGALALSKSHAFIIRNVSQMTPRPFLITA